MLVRFEDAVRIMSEKLEKHGASKEDAQKVSYEMARNSLEGTYTHGINRFFRVIRGLDSGIIDPSARPELKASFGALERYDGHLYFGVLNGLFGINRAMELASEHGIGLVAIMNTNHWMRAATYGYEACNKGYAALLFTNTIPNMPAWGAIDSHLGNNPFVMAFPKKDGKHMVFDSAMSQFSYGALEVAIQQKRKMPVNAGYDGNGNLSTDPVEVFKTRRLLPAGYWKGASMSFMLDIFASTLSLGRTVAGIGELKGDEHGVSEVFIAINYKKLVGEDEADAIAEEAISYLKSSIKAEGTDDIFYPGERMMKTKEKNLRDGIPVDDNVWADILSF